MPDRQATHSDQHIDALIARCLTGDLDDAVSEIQRLGLWEFLVSRACLIEMGGILAHRLHAAGCGLPFSAAMQLEAYCDHLRELNAYMTSRVQKPLACLSDAGVRFLMLKGAALNRTIYPDHSCRAMVDIDLLIHPEDSSRADEVLRSVGCSRGADLVSADYYPNYYYEREYFTRHRPAVKIDLHARPFRPLRYARTLPPDALWDHPMWVPFGKMDVRLPGVNNMVIHLAGHAAGHGLEGFKWLYDLYAWIEHYQDCINWQQIAAKTQAWSISWFVAQSLRQAITRFGCTPTLQAGLEALSSKKPNWRDRLVLRQSPKDNDHPFAALVTNLLTTPGLGFKLGYLRSVLLPDESHLRQLYSRQHPGWRCMAHAVRLKNTAFRPFRSAESSSARFTLIWRTTQLHGHLPA